MGKTNIFGRRSSKVPSDGGSPTNSQGSGGEKKKKSARDKPAPPTQGQRTKTQAEKKKETPKVDRRKTRDKAKQMSENKNSARRMKKRDEVKSLVQRLPSEMKSSRSSGTGGLYDSIHGSTSYVRGGRENELVDESDAESIYESRKLLIRQMQGQIAKQVHEGRDSVSEYDSWTDLEENFALAYEPIPLSIKMATWRKMTKREILRKVNSRKIRKDFEYMSHEEILDQIEKMQKNAIYLKSKFGIGHLMPQAHVAMVHRPAGSRKQAEDTEEGEEDEEEEEDEGVEESDGGISRASFVSGKEIYLSRAEILGKIHDSAPSKKVPKKSEKERPPRNGLSRHDSWSSRASSILKDPEAIYVSRVELLKKIDVHEEPRQRGGNKTRPQVKQHDSWSSRASSILAAVEAEKATLEDDEPLYISRVELLEKLQLKSLAALSAASGTSAESDSDASTVKNVPVNGNSAGQRKWKVQNNQFKKDLDSAKNIKSKTEIVKEDNNNNNNNSSQQNKNYEHKNSHNNNSSDKRNKRTPPSKQRQSSLLDEYKKPAGEKDKTPNSERRNGNPGKQVQEKVEPVRKGKEGHAEHGEMHHHEEEDFDSCSCVTCNTCHQSDCSCSEVSNSSQSSRSSHSSDGSIETVLGPEEVRAREKELGPRLNRKHSDIYIVNGSDVSKASSKISKKSLNYDPLPQNGITKVKHKKLSQTEIEQERVQNEQEVRLRSIADSEERRNEKQVKKPVPKSSKEVKGTVKSTSSWSNDQFGKIYEPVSATELRRQHQVKELKKQLQNLSPEWDKTVESISTMRRKKVLRQLKAVVTHNVDMENISEEDLGKHLDKALRHALDVNYEALKNLNLGAMYVPMETNPANSKTVSRENTDYDTFGSIDSLIFEPKIPTEEDIEEVQEEITQSFEYLENEDDGQMEPLNNGITSPFNKLTPQTNKRSPRSHRNAMAVGKTTFAERVRLFQSLGDKKGGSSTGGESILNKTTWREQALQKDERSGRESVASNLSHSTNSSGSTVIYNVNITESNGETDGNQSKPKESFLEESPSGVKQDMLQEEAGECSTCSSLSCDCWDQQEVTDDGCTCNDCPGCSQPTLRRFVGSQSSQQSGRSEVGYSRPISEARERPPSGRSKSRTSQARRDSVSSPNQQSSVSSPVRRSSQPSPNRGETNPTKRSSSRSSEPSSRPSSKSSPHRRSSVPSPSRKPSLPERSTKSSPVPPVPSKSSLKPKKQPKQLEVSEKEKLRKSSPHIETEKRKSNPRKQSPVVLQDMEGLIPVVGNLRRQLRENFNKPSLNIEKKKPKKGFIIEESEETVPRAPSVENITKTSQIVQEKIERADSFQKLQTRDQFRSSTPEAPVPPPPPREDGGGLLVQVQGGKPLIYDQQLPQQSPELPSREDMKELGLDSPKSKGSEMGDSGISSNPASMSPHSSSSSGSSASPGSEDKEAAIMKKLVPPGGKKRDTMIRELKFKLKERFPEDEVEQKSHRRRKKGAGDSDAVRSQKSEVGPKLTKIFGALMSEAGTGPGQATLLRQQRASKKEEPQARNLGVPQDDISTLRSSKLATVKEFDYQDSSCPSIYDPSLPPGLEQHIGRQTPPPPPPPTQESSKRGSVLNSSFDEQSIPSRPCSDLAAPLDRREMLYGPGGIFGPKGPFSTPGVSRYPEVPPAAKPPGRTGQPKSSSTSLTEESGLFDGDRSDKSQYICNPVMTLPEVDPFVSTRIENYRARVSPETPVELSVEQVAALSGPDPGTVDRWLEEKQRRMISWVARGGQVRSQAS